MILFRLTALSVIAGFVLDCLLGDPLGALHPVALIGKMIAFLEKKLRGRFPDTPKGQRSAGALMALLVVLLGTLGGAVPLALAWLVHPWAYFLVSSFLCWQCFAARCLMTEAKKVTAALNGEGLEAGRRQVATLVGRDTENLTRTQVIKATVETVAENTSDGVIAPLFWMALGGAAGGLFYKSINTMDSMVGYKNERYLHFGRFAARLDDAVNYIPSRLSALAMIAGAFVLKMDGSNAFRIWKRDRRKHASPNSAQTESACAGALHIQLGGSASYFGRIVEKPTIGDPDRTPEDEDVDRACRLMYGTSFLLVIVYCIFAALGGLPI